MNRKDRCLGAVNEIYQIRQAEIAQRNAARIDKNLKPQTDLELNAAINNSKKRWEDCTKCHLPYLTKGASKVCPDCR